MPQWVDDCVKRYLAKGLSKDEAWKRCMGAHEKRQKDERAKKRAARSKSK